MAKADRSNLARSGGGSTFSVLGPDVAIKGDISASADLHIDGQVEGDIACANLVQGETSRIVGSIEAESARLAGQVSGTIAARELMVLRSARIDGDVQYESLTIEQGATVDGRFAQTPPARAASSPQKSGAATAPSPQADEGKASASQLKIAH